MFWSMFLIRQAIRPSRIRLWAVCRYSRPMSTYRYTPLLALDTIRLFKLTHSSTDNTTGIRGYLEHHNIRSAPSYYAISYAWGNVAHKVSVECEGKLLHVSQNCLDLLAELNHDECNQFVWINAICVDQNNIEERSQQVAIMEQIYSKASKVIIWLGLGDSASEEAMKLLDKLYYTEKVLPQSKLALNHSEAALAEIERLTAVRDGAPYGYLEYGLIGCLLTREWFERTWTIEEAIMALPGRSWLRCGSQEAPFDSVILLLLDENIYKPRYNHLTNTIHFWRTRVDPFLHLKFNLWEVEKGAIGNLISDMAYLLVLLSHARATDPRDKVFGAYGLFKKHGWDVPRPDYGKTVDDVYAQITKTAIEVDGSLSIIEAAGEPTKMRNLPSWVPDYSRACLLRDWSDWISACAHCMPQYSFSSDDRQLTVSGQVLDTIQTCGSSFGWDNSNPWITGPAARDLMTHGTRVIADWFELARSLTQHLEDDAFDEEFISTIYHVGTSRRTFEDAMVAWSSYVDARDHGDLLSSATKRSRSVIEENLGAKFAITEARRMAMVPDGALPSDKIVAIAGNPSPFVARRSSDGEAWILIGPAYIYTVMSGEAWDKNAELQTFTLV